ncbi:ABC-type transport auxiliary lipoprotein family protein [Marinomonas sp. THO17]|uniref:PqiC family protein n=1 Tax=Marinomonas sp. THO17 TaxID=3149048 RepID=UPI00336C2E86
MRIRVWFYGVMMSLLTACASQTPPSYEYLLIDQMDQAVEAKQTPKVQVQMMPVEVANYLGGNEIVLVTNTGSVHRSQSHLWAEPLAPQLTRLTQQRLEDALPQVSWFARQRLPSYAIAQLNIEVDRFYADLQGKVQITGRWQFISAQGQIIRTQVFDVSDALRADGYGPLTQTLAKNWLHKVIDPMAEQIAIDLNKEEG